MDNANRPSRPQRRAWLAAAAGTAWGLGGCASLGTDVEPAAAPLAAPAAADRVTPFSASRPGERPAGWHPYAMRRDLAPTRYAVVDEGPARVLHARASRSATGLRCPVHIDPARSGELRFSWRVREVPRQADIAVAEHDDCPARLILAFGGDDTRLPLRERLFYEQVELFTGQRLPYATLMYVWDGGTHPVESVHRNHRTARIQYLAVESGAAHIGQWRHHRRDVVADFRRVFGEDPGPIVGVGVLTDADALKLNLEAWYGDITLGARGAG